MNNNLFGTDGIRNKVGNAPFTVTELPRLGTAIAHWAAQKYAVPNLQNLPLCLIASDTRSSCSFVKTSLISSMLLAPITLIDLGILPTPALVALLQNNNSYHFGIMISASHNPHHDNGIKLIDAKTGKLTELDEKTITSLFYNHAHTNTYTQFGSLRSYAGAAEQYKNHVIAKFTPNFLYGLTIVLDCAHGATYNVAPDIFKALGATIITINNTPDGTNINNSCGALHPEQLINNVHSYNADMGFAFDGDGDRVTIVNKHGEIKDGDDTIALLATHPRYSNEKTIVGTIMSNEGLATHLQSHNKILIRTPVGDKHISAYLAQHNLLLGGEQSGHIIMRDYLNSGDGIFSALSIIEAALHTNNNELHTFAKYPQVLINIPITQKKELTSQPYATIIADYAKKLSNGRLEVRYSGTENLLRVMVESLDKIHALSIGNQLASTLKKELSII